MKLAYQAYDRQGRTISDVIDAASFAEATESLRRDGLFVAEIAPAAGAAGPAAMPRRGGMRDLAIFTKQLYVLASTGSPVPEALAALQRQMRNPAWKAVLADIIERVEEGEALSEAMAVHPGFFDDIYRSLIAAGEASGQLVSMLQRLALLVNKRWRTQSTLRGAMIYPIALTGIAVIVLNLVMLFVVPRFMELFETLEVPLPATTRMLLAASDLAMGYWWLGLLILGGAGFAAWRQLRSPAGRAWRDGVVLRLPVLGKLAQGFAVARIARLLGSLVESNVTLLEALQLTQHAAGNVHYASLLADAEQAVTQGEPVSRSFYEHPLIPEAFYEALRNGERSGKMGPLLVNIADLLDDENETTLKAALSLIEPAILVGLGLLVGAVAVSMFLPLFDLTAMASGGGG
jgi:type IV pilus assembly protein PilC